MAHRNEGQTACVVHRMSFIAGLTRIRVHQVGALSIVPARHGGTLRLALERRASPPVFRFSAPGKRSGTCLRAPYRRYIMCFCGPRCSFETRLCAPFRRSAIRSCAPRRRSETQPYATHLRSDGRSCAPPKLCNIRLRAPHRRSVGCFCAQGRPYDTADASAL